MLTYVIIAIALILFFFFMAFALVSYKEKEPLAMQKALILSFFLPASYLGTLVLPQPYSTVIAVIFAAVFAGSLLVLLLPFNTYPKQIEEQPKQRIDERVSMFSRKEINKKNTQHKEAYYAMYPQHVRPDAEWMEKPGLMHPKSQYYSPFTFKAAEASFDAIEHMHALVDGPISPEKTEVNAKELSILVKKWAKKLGAVDAGICLTQPYHYYSVKGRGADYNKEINSFHKYAIALTVEMDAEFLATGPAGPTLMESAQQYFNSGSIAIQIAQYLRSLGYASRAHIDGNYQVVCPLVGRDAGLGEIGRMGLLMTPKLGPRVRIAVVTSDAPLLADSRNYDGSVHHFCSICEKCADTCPSQAIPKGKKTTINGVERWQINQEKCFNLWCSTGTDCGRCMSTCPYSHPNNWMHNIIRWGIKRSQIFRYLALWMDDFFYGRKPKPKKIPAWLKLKEKTKS